MRIKPWPRGFDLRGLWLFLPLVLLAACGSDSHNVQPSVKYYLEQAATGTTSNALRLEAGDFKPKFSLSGTGYVADVPFDVIQDFKERTELTADDFGQVDVKVTLYQEDDKPYIADTLTWKSSGEIPPKPEPYFSETASSDDYVYLVFPASRGKNTQEAWVAGDLDPTVADGSFYPIPKDDQVLIKLGPGDGMKTVKVRYRNIFGALSVATELSILKKAQPPANCKATPVALKTATGSIRIRLQADNDGPLFYKITGDVDQEKGYISFTDTLDAVVGLSPGEGVKRLTVKMKDEAGNFCVNEMKLAITYDHTYVPGSLTLEGQPIWTNDVNVVALPAFDHLPGDNITMQIMGNVLASSFTLQWIPFAERVPLVLTPSSGPRHVIVQYRQDDTLMAEVDVVVFLNPYIIVNGAAPSQTLTIGNITGATDITITGCVESYQHVPFLAVYPCTKASANAVVTYNLVDGTQLTLSHAL